MLLVNTASMSFIVSSASARAARTASLIISGRVTSRRVLLCRVCPIPTIATLFGMSPSHYFFPRIITA